jgi:hypothetical protein
VTDLLQAPPLLGSTEPRLWTQPLVPLNRDTSYGFEVVDFAEEIGHPLLPWQKFAVIHGGELLPDGRPRFRIVLLVVSRQNGKTELPVVLSVYWQFRQKVPLILGTSTKLSYAKESWLKAVNLVRATPSLHGLHAPGRKWLRATNGETESWSNAGNRYLIAASNSEGGRSLTVDRGVADELRQHRSYEAWDAFEPACSPPGAQIWALSNAGDSRSVVLNDLQDSAREFIETGVGDERLGLLEWSAPDDSDPEDVDALLQSNPRVGYGLDLAVLQAGAARAKRLGGEALTGFQTERMCIRVKVLNPAIPARVWDACREPGDLLESRGRIACCIDVAPDGTHATLAAAGVLDDGRVRVETLAEWTGPRAVSDMERDLPSWARLVGPRVFGWLPRGPTAAAAASLQRPGWGPRSMRVEEIRSDTPAVCMAFGKEVSARTAVHSGQEMLDAQVGGAERSWEKSVWVFTRRGGGNVDAVYAVAGAAWLARTMPRRREVSTRARGV